MSEVIKKFGFFALTLLVVILSYFKVDDVEEDLVKLNVDLKSYTDTVETKIHNIEGKLSDLITSDNSILPSPLSVESNKAVINLKAEVKLLMSKTPTERDFINLLERVVVLESTINHHRESDRHHNN